MNNIFELSPEMPKEKRLELIKNYRAKPFFYSDFISRCEFCGKIIKQNEIFCANCRLLEQCLKRKGNEKRVKTIKEFKQKQERINKKEMI